MRTSLRPSMPLALAIALAMPGAFAEPASQHYQLPAQPLDQALREIARQSGRSIVADPALVRGRASHAVDGDFDAEDAARRALQGSGLQLRTTENGTLTVERTPEGDTLELGATTVNAAALGETTEGTGSYTTGALTIGKGAHTLKETPQSVTVITRKLMDDQNLNTIDQVMEKTPGITVSGSPMAGQYFYSRGFKMDAPYQYDGVPLDIGSSYVQANSFGADMTVYDRVEILRGASGMMKGAGTPTGAVNLVRKRGQATPTASVTLQGGSWDNYRGQVDVGGPLNADGTLRGRAVVAKQDRQYFYDIAKRGDDIAYAALDYDFTPDTTAGIGFAYERVDATPCWGGLPRYADGSDLKLSRSTCLGASWNTWDSKRNTVWADISQRLNDDWRAKLSAIYTHNTQDMKYLQGAVFSTVAVGSDNGALTPLAGLFDYDQTDYGFDGFIDGKFRAFGLEHELTLGANTSRSRSNDVWALERLTGTTIDAFDPGKVAEPSDSEIIANSYRGGWPYPSKIDIKQTGAYANLRLKLAEPLTLVLGSRVSWYDYYNDNKSYGSVSTSRMTETGQVTPFAALLYDIDPHLTVYASYADVFQPQSYVDADGKPLPPKTGKNYELGIKGEWFDGALNGTANLFQAYQEHAAGALDSSCNCSYDTGKVRAQGVELEMSGSPIERLQVLAGYTYTQTKTLSAVRNVNVAASDGDTYNTLVPRHLLRVWGDYELAGALRDFSVGGGVTAQSDIYRLSNSVKSAQAGYAIWSGRIQYHLDEHWSVALNGNNLFDKKYYQTIGDRLTMNYYGDPRNFMVTLKGSF
ncbi:MULTISPECIES: TonB-dependent receptor [Pseudomonas]|nr:MULTISPECIES: TonB-dependent receptor [Pseudomonas]EJU9614702.1 TonB-dependent siderophore receptor [Pseudomonas aeruginosa]EKU2931527.1 TonB-dependent siderophore receptor [Pseudomonas aeruginosa]ELM0223572.1 TonB-dependent siderophore receptor [Pseudomonas aeruginosa]MCS9398047.1 TonB-dependent receptor [Pseudomonas aeruginosa]MCT0410229.1 TonB-dependent receptor [Pseudomonas aeruginosa]